VFPDHRREFEPIQFRHANIDQNNRDLGLQQILQRLLG